MKALLSERCGPASSLVLQDVEDPTPGTNEVVVEVEACGINYPDALMIEDRYQFKIERPFSPGIEICGRICGLGSGVTAFGIGDRVVAQLTSGGLAERAVARADRLVLVPDGVEPIQAASVLLTYGTSYHALRDRADLQRGENLLVLGAGGGVGLAAVDLGRRMGAKVVAAVSSASKAEAASAAGADHVILYDAKIDQKALAHQFKDACPSGFNVVYDPVGGDYAEPALRAIAWKGRYLVVGFPAGVPRIPSNLVLLKGAQMVGVFWGSAVERDPEILQRNMAEILDWLATGKLASGPTAVYPLERGGDAIAILAAREAVGKLVVTP